MPKSATRRVSRTLRIGSRRSGCGPSQLPAVQRETVGKIGDAAANRGEGIRRIDVVQDLGDQRTDLAHFRLAKSARGNGGTAQAYADRKSTRLNSSHIPLS